jgi:hypothetical protein
MNENDRHDEELPRAIAERLRARDRNVAFLTPRIDAALERAAAEHFAGRAEPAHARKRWAKRWAIPAAAAAALLAAIIVLRPGGHFEPPAPMAASNRTDDIDGSGQVDILDAFALARAQAGAGVEADAASPAAQRDVAALAARIVALSPPANSERTERVL